MARINKTELILKHRPPNAGPGSSWRVPFEQLRADGWPGSATKHASFWGSNAKKALVGLGMRATMRKKDEVVEFRILKVEPAEVPPEPEPPPPPEPPVEAEPPADCEGGPAPAVTGADCCCATTPFTPDDCDPDTDADDVDADAGASVHAAMVGAIEAARATSHVIAGLIAGETKRRLAPKVRRRPARRKKSKATVKDTLAAAEALAGSTDFRELFRRYTKATGEERPVLERGFGKVDIALAVVRAEAGA